MQIGGKDPNIAFFFYKSYLCAYKAPLKNKMSKMEIWSRIRLFAIAGRLKNRSSNFVGDQFGVDSFVDDLFYRDCINGEKILSNNVLYRATRKYTGRIAALMTHVITIY